MTRKAGVSCATLLMRIILTSLYSDPFCWEVLGDQICAPFCLSCPEPARKSKKLAIAQVVSNKPTLVSLLFGPFFAYRSWSWRSKGVCLPLVSALTPASSLGYFQWEF